VTLFPRIVGVLALLVATCGCDRPAPPGTPNLLLISVDTLRSDHLGCYGYDRPTSPNIDALARRGVVFDNMVSTSSWTLPVHGSMLTGRYPEFHGLREDGVRLAPEIPTVAELLRGRGYHTFGVVSHVYVSSAFGLDRGFDAYDDAQALEGINLPAEPLVDRFLELADRAPAGPFFGFLHLFDPHWDYTPPPPFDSRFTDPSYDGPIDGTYPSMGPFLQPGAPMPEADLRQLVGYYDGEIAYLDHQLGRLMEGLDARGLLDDTIVLFTADHGEEFKEHGQLGHAKTLYGEQLRVPLIIAGDPRFPAGTRCGDLLSVTDLAPTLLELAGGAGDEGFQGRSIVGGGADPDRVVFAESIRFGIELRAARRVSEKLIHYLQGDLRRYFDLAADPGEQRPLAEDPSGGPLTAALGDFAAAADSGWHVKLISLTDDAVTCRASIHSEGRIVHPRRYFADRASGSAVFSEFELDPDGATLRFEVTVRSLMGEIAFVTDPPDAPVTFEVAVTGADGSAGPFLASGERLPEAEPVTLTRSDPRLTTPRRPYWEAAPGCHIRAVAGVGESAPESELSEEALERLRSLGYIGPGPDR
jgi:arylsulfatase A-like enzyme